MRMVADDKVGTRGKGLPHDLLLVAVRLCVILGPGVHDRDDRGAAQLPQEFHPLMVGFSPVAGQGTGNADKADLQRVTVLPDRQAVSCAWNRGS